MRSYLNFKVGIDTPENIASEMKSDLNLPNEDIEQIRS